METLIVDGVPYLFLSPSCTAHSRTQKNANELKIAQEQHIGVVCALAAFFSRTNVAIDATWATKLAPIVSATQVTQCVLKR